MSSRRRPLSRAASKNLTRRRLLDAARRVFLRQGFHGTTVDYRVAPGSAQFDFIAAQKDAQNITGLGDRAVWLGAGRTRGNLAVVRGNTAVLVTITDLSGHRQLEQKARDLARLVLEQL